MYGPSLPLLAAALSAAMLCVAGPTSAQNVDPKATEKPPAADAKDAAKKADEFAEAEKHLGGPAATGMPLAGPAGGKSAVAR
jgi:hypothetical protein